MGYALIWIEGLAAALLALALATAWALRGSRVRWLGVASVYVLFLGAALLLTLWTYQLHTSADAHLIRTTWFYYTLTWLITFVAGSLVLLREGLRRPQPWQTRAAASWSAGALSFGLGGALLMFALTIWNMDLASRANLAIGRQEAGALLLDMTPPPVPDAENAARVYAEAAKLLPQTVRNPWADASRRGLDSQDLPNWRDSYVVELVKKHEDALTLLRQGAAMPQCRFDRQRTLLDAVEPDWPIGFFVTGQGIKLLAIDARVKATQGNVGRAFEDISAILGIVRHTAEDVLFGWAKEDWAWRTLEDVLRLTPDTKEPLPTLAAANLPPLAKMVRKEHALLGMLFPAVASQPSLIRDEIKQKNGPWAVLVLDALVVPARVFVMQDELAAMHKLFEEYQKSPRRAREETPKTWADLQSSVEMDRTSLLGIQFIKPKHRVLVKDGSMLVALRQTAQTGLAVAAYRRKHGQFPERLEQLVPEYMPSVPIDPRDGQPLRIRRFAEGVVLYTSHDRAVAEGDQLRDSASRWPAPIFRLYAP